MGNRLGAKNEHLQLGDFDGSIEADYGLDLDLLESSIFLGSICRDGKTVPATFNPVRTLFFAKKGGQKREFDFEIDNVKT